LRTEVDAAASLEATAACDYKVMLQIKLQSEDCSTVNVSASKVRRRAVHIGEKRLKIFLVGRFELDQCI